MASLLLFSVPTVRRHHHSTPTLNDLHLFPIRKRIYYKLMTLSLHIKPLPYPSLPSSPIYIIHLAQHIPYNALLRQTFPTPLLSTPHWMVATYVLPP